jgi:hypothetical protein
VEQLILLLLWYKRNCLNSDHLYEYFGVIAKYELHLFHHESQLPDFSSVVQTNSVVLSPQTKYTDWATATYRRNLVPTFANRGLSRGQRDGSPTVFNLQFYRPDPLLFFQVAPHLSLRGWVDPVAHPLPLRIFGSAGNRTQDLWISSQELWPLDHRGGLLRQDRIKIWSS